MSQTLVRARRDYRTQGCTDTQQVYRHPTGVQTPSRYTDTHAGDTDTQHAGVQTPRAVGRCKIDMAVSRKHLFEVI